MAFFQNHSLPETLLGSQNAMAIKVLQQIAEAPGKMYNPLFLYGTPSSGKTFLLQQFQKWAKQHQGTLEILFIDANTFKNTYLQGLKLRPQPGFLNQKYRHYQIFILDDIEQLSGKNTLEQFRFLFDFFQNTSIQMIFTGTVHPHSLKFPEALKNRLLSGMVIALSTPDCAGRIQFIQHQLQLASIPHKWEVVAWVAEQFEGSYSCIQGKLETLYQKNPFIFLSLEDCQSFFFQKHLSLELLKKRVAREFQILPEELTSKTNKQAILYPRILTIFLAHHCLGIPLKTLEEHYQLSCWTIRRALKKAESFSEDPWMGPILCKLLQECKSSTSSSG